MRVRHLQTYIQEQGLSQQCHVSELQKMTLGVDVATWTRGLLDLKDPFAELLGGLPLATPDVIDRQLECFADAEISPLFFLQGLSPNGHSLFTKIDKRAITDAWRLVVDHQLFHAHSKLGRVASRLTEELVCYLSRYLRARCWVDYHSSSRTAHGAEASTPSQGPGRDNHTQQPAPRRFAVVQCSYLVSGQMNYFMQTGLIDAAFGLTSFLLVGLPRVVISLDFSHGQVEWVEKDTLLHQWQVREDQLRDACILAGTEFCHTLPFLTLQPAFSFDTALNLAKGAPLTKFLAFFPNQRVRNEFEHLYGLSKSLLYLLVAIQGRGQVGALVANGPRPSAISEAEVRRGTLAENARRLQQEEKRAAEQFAACNVPQDIKLVRGWKLPDAVFLLMLEGLISPMLPKVLSYGEWRDFDSPIVLPRQYETMLVQCRSYRLLGLGLIARHLHPSFHQRRITFEYISRHCADPMVLLAVPSETQSQYVPDMRPLLNWTFTIRDVEHQLQARKLDTPNFIFALDWHISSMHKQFETEYGELGITVHHPSEPILGEEPLSMKQNLISVSEADASRIERLAQRHLSTGPRPRRRRLAPAQNYVLAWINFQLLDALGYFNLNQGNQRLSEDGPQSPIGAPTALGIMLRERCQPNFEQKFIVALELYKLGILTGKAYTYGEENQYPVPLVNPPVHPYHPVVAKAHLYIQQKRLKCPFLELNEVQTSVRLVTRVASLCHVTLKDGLTACPKYFLDFDIAAFQAFVKNVKRSLNYLVEGCITNIALQKPILGRLMTPDLFDPISPRVVWFRPELGVGGVIIREILLSPYRTPREIDAHRIQFERQFPDVKNVWLSLLTLCEFYAQLSKIIQKSAAGTNNEVAEEFRRADLLLCIQMVDYLAATSGEVCNGIHEDFPSFSELLEKNLESDLGAIILPARNSLAACQQQPPFSHPVTAIGTAAGGPTVSTAGITSSTVPMGVPQTTAVV